MSVKPISGAFKLTRKVRKAAVFMAKTAVLELVT